MAAWSMSLPDPLTVGTGPIRKLSSARYYRHPAGGPAMTESMTESLDSPAPRLFIRSVPLPRPHQGDVRRRLAQAAVVTGRRLAPMAGPLARRQPVDTTALARALRLVFDDMGGTFAKFGQLIGSASGLFGEAFSAEFRTTLDNVTPIPFPAVKLAVEDAFGFPLDQLFASFDEEPIAAASLAAVHRAVLRDGRTVAVKVLRPGIEDKMAIDLAVMGPLFDFLGHQLAVGILGEFPALISGLEEQLSEEVDMRNEARSMAWFEHLRQTLEFERLEVPLPIDGFVAKRVLVMSFVSGVSIDDTEAIAALGVDPAPLVQECVKAWFASALCTGAFHGDVHAGNLLVTDGGRLGLLDWGIVGRLDLETQHFFRRVVEGALGDDGAWVDVWKITEAAYGPALQESLGFTDEQMVLAIRMQIEPIFHRPFGEVKLSDLMVSADTLSQMVGAAPTPPSGWSTRARRAFGNWRTERAFRREQRDSGVRETSFDRSMFLLGKQLIYFERYGKLFLPDTPLIHDPAAFERLLAEPMVAAEVAIS
jgi:predicted unusual protein kinase regulating ubiquinone biosynthesis (AarF/ABC1/UbiB family)